MSSLPGGDAVFHGRLLVCGDVLADALTVSHVLCLVWAGDGSGQVEPEVGFNVILGNTHANGVKQPKRTLRARVALVGGLTIPGYRLGHIAGHAATIAIEIGKMNLCRNAALVCGLQVPRGGLPVIGGQLAGVTRRSIPGGVCVCRLDLGVDVTRGGFGKYGGVDGSRRRGRGLRQRRDERQAKRADRKDGM